MKPLTRSLLLLLIGSSAALRAAIDDDAVRLRNLGLAELENEQPAKAADYFRQLVDRVPDEPLPLANLAIAALRQQAFDEASSAIDRALALAPDDPELLAIKGEILQWSGRPEAALPVFEKAAGAAPDNVEIQYALLRQATTLSGEGSAMATVAALDRLRQLRPENLVVLMQAGQQRLAAADRAGATDIYLRVREVLWQAPPAAMTLLEQILQALASGDLEAARIPALRLENVVKITPMFREGLRELSPGIQGVPIERFRDEPLARSFGPVLPVRFVATPISDRGSTAGGLVRGDFDGDQQSDWARLTATTPGELEIWLGGAGDGPRSTLPLTGLGQLITADLDNDGVLDLIGLAPGTIRILRGRGDGSFEDATATFGLQGGGAVAAAVLDFDIEGDLDLATAGGASGATQLYRNQLVGALEPVGDKVLPTVDLGTPRDLLASDLDRDGDVDLLIVHDRGLTWLDNLRQGQFTDRTAVAGLGAAAAARSVVSADLDNDGLPDLVTVGRGLQFLHNLGGRFAIWPIGSQLQSDAEMSSIRAFDANNDGRLDLAIGGPNGLAVALQGADHDFTFASLVEPPTKVTSLVDIDLDQDCDLDLLVGTDRGLWRLENEGGNKNHCLTVRLQGLDKGNSKNNHFGFGSTLEIRSGDAYQFREVAADTTHLGVGRLAKVDLLRVVWTNGVPQNRLQPQAQQRIVEEQVLKGSCPFVYTVTPAGVEFVTDLLWGAPIGLPLGPGIWASADPQELVKLPAVEAQAGQYDLRLTEELWEAAFFDHVRLWIVDHPQEVEVASSLRIVPGQQLDDRVLATRQLRSLAAVRVNDLHEVTDRVRSRDEIYASPWQESPYQGVSAEPWSLILDLGVAPAAPVRLHLDGWIFPTDASLNLALAQQQRYQMWPPRLEVETGQGWQPLVEDMGFPAGKTKTMVVDTPPLPPGSRRLRIVGTQWLSFDRIAWSTAVADEEPVVRARLTASTAELRYRGFSRSFRPAPNGPHYFDYAQTRAESPWLPFPGRYTRYGDVRELLESPDDRSVIMAPGDEIRLLFDATTLPPLRSGWQRTVFLESHGWDKDADRNTGAGTQVEPLPFRAMRHYPYGEDETPPDSEIYRDYLENWLTREIRSLPPAPPGTAP